MSSATARWTSLENRMARAGRRPSGFDYLRLFLALCVVVWHAFPLSYGGRAVLHDLPGQWVLAPVNCIVPMFFALGGFLVAESLLRSKSVLTFVALRAIRIEPALFVEVVLSALVIGPVLTTVPLAEYFSSRTFQEYFLNVVADSQYTLPGLFESNPSRHFVNAQLWTIPWEIKAYALLALLGALGIGRNRWLVLLTTLAAFLLLCAVGLNNSRVMANAFQNLAAYRLLLCFLAGVSLYHFREAIPWNGWLFAGCAVLQIVLIGGGGIGGLVAPFPVAYVAAYLGLANPRRVFPIVHGDFSYGVYLYGYVIQQALMALLPWARHWYLNLLLSLPVIGALAAFSWFFVEKPAQKLRRYLPGEQPVTDPQASPAQQSQA